MAKRLRRLSDLLKAKCCDVSPHLLRCIRCSAACQLLPNDAVFPISREWMVADPETMATCRVARPPRSRWAIMSVLRFCFS